MDYELLNEVSLLYDMKDCYKAVMTLLDVYPGQMTIKDVKNRLEEKINDQENKIGSYKFVL